MTSIHIRVLLLRHAEKLFQAHNLREVFPRVNPEGAFRVDPAAPLMLVGSTISGINDALLNVITGWSNSSNLHPSQDCPLVWRCRAQLWIQLPMAVNIYRLRAAS